MTLLPAGGQFAAGNYMQLARQRKATGAPTKGNWRTNEDGPTGLILSIIVIDPTMKQVGAALADRERSMNFHNVGAFYAPGTK